MQHTITTIYGLCDDFLQAMNHRDDPQSHLSSVEVMSVSLVAACSFGGKVERAQEFLHEHGYLPKSLSPSRLNRRLHALPLRVCIQRERYRKGCFWGLGCKALSILCVIAQRNQARLRKQWPS